MDAEFFEGKLQSHLLAGMPITIQLEDKVHLRQDCPLMHTEGLPTSKPPARFI
jgi:hypothetical protein